MNSGKRLDELMKEIPDSGPSREQHTELHALLKDLEARPKWRVNRHAVIMVIFFIIGVVGAQLLVWLMA